MSHINGQCQNDYCQLTQVQDLELATNCEDNHCQLTKLIIRIFIVAYPHIYDIIISLPVPDSPEQEEILPIILTVVGVEEPFRRMVPRFVNYKYNHRSGGIIFKSVGSQELPLSHCTVSQFSHFNKGSAYTVTLDILLLDSLLQDGFWVGAYGSSRPLGLPSNIFYS